jgi:hypothetical protein
LSSALLEKKSRECYKFCYINLNYVICKSLSLCGWDVNRRTAERPAGWHSFSYSAPSMIQRFNHPPVGEPARTATVGACRTPTVKAREFD